MARGEYERELVRRRAGVADIRALGAEGAGAEVGRRRTGFFGTIALVEPAFFLVDALLEGLAREPVWSEGGQQDPEAPC